MKYPQEEDERNKTMKKSIKLLSLLLVAVFLCLSMASCDNKTNETHTDAPTEVPTEAPTEVETEHTEHVGAGKCEVCSADYFAIAENYIKENGTWIGNHYSLSYTINHAKYDIAVFDDPNYTDTIVIRALSDPDDYHVEFRLSKSGVKYGEYDWKCYHISAYGDGKTSGRWFPGTISPNAAIYLENNTSNMSESRTQAAIEKANFYGRIMINDIFIPFLEEVGHDLTPSDFGFVRFED